MDPRIKSALLYQLSYRSAKAPSFLRALQCWIGDIIPILRFLHHEGELIPHAFIASYLRTDSPASTNLSSKKMDRRYVGACWKTPVGASVPPTGVEPVTSDLQDRRSAMMS